MLNVIDAMRFAAADDVVLSLAANLPDYLCLSDRIFTADNIQVPSVDAIYAFHMLPITHISVCIPSCRHC